MRVRLLAFALVAYSSAAAAFTMPGMVARPGLASLRMQDASSSPAVTFPTPTLQAGTVALSASPQPARLTRALQVAETRRPLDPLELTTNKAMQGCPLRPYRSPAENGGLETATLALG
jgi:hypothetical protein